MRSPGEGYSETLTVADLKAIVDKLPANNLVFVDSYDGILPISTTYNDDITDGRTSQPVLVLKCS